jgi:hypothetical protein
MVQGMAMFGLNDVQLFWERSLDTRVLVGWSDNMIVLSFRGTASLRNAFADIQVCCCLLSGLFMLQACRGHCLVRCGARLLGLATNLPVRQRSNCCC